MSQLSRIRRLHALLIMAAGWAIVFFVVTTFAGHHEYGIWLWWLGWGVIGAGAGAFLSFTVRGAIIGAVVLVALLAEIHYLT
ncbi:MAG TPA: hypothetical protein VMJ32_01670 [Pirellulales bacterium]|nr:hypothetical protein [Pirellulales bacterium]